MKSTLTYQRIPAPSPSSVRYVYSVQKGVEIPPRGRPKLSPSEEIYPFAIMEVGDSFELKDSKDIKELMRVQAAASNYGRRHDKKFGVRILDPVTKVRCCWRVA